MKRKLISLALVICIMISIMPAALAGDVTYTDVKKESWYASYVNSISNYGYMNGTGNNMFSPDMTLSRAMFVTVLGRIHGASPEYYNEKKSAFSDVEAGQWYTPYVAWAAEAGITSGVGDGKFAPNDLVTREQMATFIYRYTKKYDISLEETYFPAKPFSDAWNISDFAKEAVELMRLTGIVTGTDKGEFLPKNGATRAEAAAVLMRLIYAMPLDYDKAVEGVDYTISYKNVRTYNDSIDQPWTQIVVEIKNIGVKNLYLRSADVDYDSAEGTPFGTSLVFPHGANVISPGETAYFYDETIVDGITAGDRLYATVRADIVTAKISNTKLPVSGFKMTDSEYGWIDIVGKVTNTTNEVKDIQIDVVLYDSNEMCVGIVSDYVYDVPANSTVNFDGSSFSLPTDITVKSIANYKISAYPDDYQY